MSTSKLYRAAKLQMSSPRWFTEVEEAIRERGVSFQHDAGLDHHRHYKNVAIFQPYHAEGKDLAILLAVCHEMGLKVHLCGSSYYLPGRTFSIAVWRPQDDKQFHEYRWEAKDLGIDVEAKTI